jgi:hypothetical protein
MSAWTVISHTEVPSGGAANIQFNSISGSYTDLVMLLSVRGSQNSTWDWLTISFNGDSGSNYSSRRVYGTGNSVSVNAQGVSTYIENGLINGNTSTSNTFSNVLIYIQNYSSTNNKLISINSVSEHNATTEAYALIGTALWGANSNPITSIVLDSSAGGTWLQNSSATLYGITKGSSGGVTVS